MLRDYQQAAVDKMIADKDVPGNSVLCLGTAAGKSHVIAEYANKVNTPVLILCPNKEILAQNKEKLLPLVDKGDVGMYSASMNEKTIKKFTFASIGSIYKKPQLFSAFGTIIVDECHNVRPDQPLSMYMKFFDYHNFPKTFGLSATPYVNVTRTEFVGSEDGFRIWDTTTTLQIISRMSSPFWSRIIFNYDAKKLKENWYTAPVEYIENNIINPDYIRTNYNGVEFDQDAFARKMSIYEDKIVWQCKDVLSKHQSVLVFCANVEQATTLSSKVMTSAVLSAKTPTKLRTEIINKFKNGEIKMLFNVQCLTTGFDAPRIDAIICVRPTKSIGLYQQFIGRGVRISPGKTKCTVYDLCGNYHRLGPAEEIRLKRDSDGKINLTSSSGKFWHNTDTGTFRIKSRI